MKWQNVSKKFNRLYQNLSHEGWKTYRDTADLPTGFMHDQTGVQPVDDSSVMGEPFANVPIRVLGGEVLGLNRRRRSTQSYVS